MKTEKKKYQKPEIVFETKIETKAGSPPGGEGLNPINLFPNEETEK